MRVKALFLFTRKRRLAKNTLMQISKQTLYSLLAIIFILLFIGVRYAYATITPDEPLESLEVANIEPEEVLEPLTPQEYAKQEVIRKWGEDHWYSFNNIISHESGWCHTKWNGQTDCPDVARKVKIPGMSNAQGLCQTMLSVHGLKTDYDFMNDPYRQIDWCINYAESGNHGVMPFSNPNEAWNYWQVHHHW